MVSGTRLGAGRKTDPHPFQLNLRNDNLRRRFDSLKYDLKRCEDVVYDLTLRGLGSAPAA